MVWYWSGYGLVIVMGMVGWLVMVWLVGLSWFSCCGLVLVWLWFGRLVKVWLVGYVLGLVWCGVCVRLL